MVKDGSKEGSVVSSIKEYITQPVPKKEGGMVADVLSFFDNLQTKPPPVQAGVGAAGGFGFSLSHLLNIFVNSVMPLDGDQLLALAKQYLPYALAPAGLYATFKLLGYLVPGPHQLPALKYKDKTVLITGASSGVGRSLAIDLYRRGARLILTARSLDKLKELCEELKQTYDGNPNEPQYSYMDICDLNKVDELAKLSPNGQIDILINNAGMSMRGRIEDIPMEIHRQVMETNYFGHVAVTKALLPFIPKDGCIIVVSSLQGKFAVPYRSSYSASKHALQAFFDTLRCEQGPKFHILVVSAGYMNTGFGSRAVDAEGKETGKEDPHQLKGMSSEAASKEILRAASAREIDLAMAPLLHRLAIFIRWATPNLFFYAMYKRGLSDEFSKKRK